MYIGVNEQGFVAWCGEKLEEMPVGLMPYEFKEITEKLQIRDRIGWVWRMRADGRLELPKESERAIGGDQWLLDID